MSIYRTSSNRVSRGQAKPYRAKSISVWTRPSDWLTMTIPGSSEQKAVGLLAIFPQGNNNISLLCNITDATQYTVDWGDGTTSDVNSGVRADKTYTYSSISSDTDSTRGYRQVIVTVTPKTEGKTFSIIKMCQAHPSDAFVGRKVFPWLEMAIASSTATTVRPGGRDGTTDNGTASMLEKLQILNHNMSSWQSTCAYMYALQVFSISPNTSPATVTDMFLGCKSLKDLPYLNFAAATSFSGLFRGCQSIQYIYSLAGTPTSAANAFNECTSLESAPFFNAASCTNFDSIFTNCHQLKSVPLYDTANVSTWTNAFNSCRQLQTVPLFNTASATGMSAMFSGCSNLESVPLFDLSIVTTTSAMFSSTPKLTSVPNFNMPLNQNIQTMLQGSAVQSVPDWNTTVLAAAQTVFGSGTLTTTLGAPSLVRDIGAINLRAINAVANQPIPIGSTTAAQAMPIKKISAINNKFSLSLQYTDLNATELDTFYTNCMTLSNIEITVATSSATTRTYTVGTTAIWAFSTNIASVSRTVDIAGMTPSAYNATGATITAFSTANGTFTIATGNAGTATVFGTATITDNRTITVSNTPGAASDDPTIATNKGWTVTG